MKEDGSPLDQFFISLYQFRDKVYENVIDYTSDSVNLVLMKIQIYRAFIFVGFYKKKIQPEIEKQVKMVQIKLGDIYKSPSPELEFETIS